MANNDGKSVYSSGQFMNPGPAPRPPTDRPRLNLTPDTNVPGSMANMVISPIRSTATSTYTGSTISLPLAARQLSNNTDGLGGVAIKKEGWAHVKENKNFIQPWKLKYLILRKESLDFHKHEGGKVVYTLYLKDVVNVGRVEAAGTIFEIKRNAQGASTSPGDDDGTTKTLQMKVKSDDDLYDWIDLIYGSCPGMGGVSNPTNFSHAVHVGFDPQTGDFVGLPPEWAKLLNSSAITKEDYERNPQAVFEVLDFYSDLTKKQDNPNQQYAGTSSTAAPGAQQQKPYGYTGGGGSSVAPPRPLHPQQQAQQSRQPPYNTAQPQSSQIPPQRPSPPQQQPQPQQRPPMQGQSSGYSSQESLREEQRKKQLEAQQRQREAEERERREQAEYNASLPKTRQPLAQQELGGYGGGSPGPDRFNPTRPAPSAPSKGSSQSPNGLRPQRPAPPVPASTGSSRPPAAQQGASSNPQQSRPSPSQNSPSRYQQNTGAASGTKQQQNNSPSNAPASRLPAPVKPLNVAPKPSQTQQQADSVKAAEAALTAKPSAAEKKQESRPMSTMSETEVMARLKEVVSKDDPNMSYSKQKKIGQGASGSVYVAKIKEGAVSAVARDVARQYGPRAQVAIKQMDLAHQPRKELIVNEIMVMRDSRHKNIVNFLDAFLRNNNAELWVVMEFMEGGALTDIIDNNPTITEDQISTICLEVWFFCPHCVQRVEF